MRMKYRLRSFHILKFIIAIIIVVFFSSCSSHKIQKRNPSGFFKKISSGCVSKIENIFLKNEDFYYRVNSYSKEELSLSSRYRKTINDLENILDEKISSEEKYELEHINRVTNGNTIGLLLKIMFTHPNYLSEKEIEIFRKSKFLKKYFSSQNALNDEFHHRINKLRKKLLLEEAEYIDLDIRNQMRGNPFKRMKESAQILGEMLDNKIDINDYKELEDVSKGDISAFLTKALFYTPDQLSKKEFEIIKKSKIIRSFLSASIALKSSFYDSLRLIGKGMVNFGYLTSGPRDLRLFDNESTFFKQLFYGLWENFLILARNLKPLPLSNRLLYLTPYRLPKKEFSVKGMKFGGPKKYKIFDEQWVSSGKKVLTKEEEKYLEDKSLLHVYVNKQKLIEKYPRFHKLKVTLFSFKEILLTLSGIYFVNHAIEILNTNFQSKRDFFDGSELKSNQIQIIVNEAPFPHLAIRIGDKVYSYGVEKMTSTFWKEYFSSKNLREALKKRGYIDEEKSEEETNFYVNKIDKWFKNVRLLPDSVILINISLTDEEVSNLNTYLTYQVGKYYQNITGSNDCATMIARALHKNTSLRIPYIIDASPNQIAMYFSMKKRLQEDERGKAYWNDKWILEPRVDQIFQMATQDENKKLYHSFRNLYLSIIESRTFSNFFYELRSVRLYLDINYDNDQNIDFYGNEDDSIQWWNEFNKAEIKKWEEEAGTYINELAQIDSLRILVDDAKNSSKNDQDVKNKEFIMISVKSLIDSFNCEEIESQNLSEDSLNSFVTRVKAKFKDEAIKKRKNEINDLLLEVNEMFDTDFQLD